MAKLKPSFPAEEKVLLTIQEAVHRYGVGKSKWNEMIAGKEVRSVKLAGRRLIYRSSIEELLSKAA